MPSWRDGASRQAILDFIERVTDENGPDYVPPDERITAFDNDGTLWCEKPMYNQLVFILQHMVAAANDNPKLRDRQPWKAAIEQDYAWFDNVVTKHYQGDDSDIPALAGGILQTFAGTTIDEFEESIVEFFRTESHPTLNRLYAECIYKPMVELLDCFTQHGFTNYISSGGGRDFMRPVTLDLYGIPRERVIGSSTALRFVPDEAGGDIVHLAELDVFSDGPAKPVSIWNRTGRRPIFVAGNSNGDIAMMQFAEQPSRPSFGLLLLHDDDEREFAYTAGADKALEAAEARDWTVVSMREDWNTIF